MYRLGVQIDFFDLIRCNILYHHAQNHQIFLVPLLYYYRFAVGDAKHKWSRNDEELEFIHYR